MRLIKNTDVKNRQKVGLIGKVGKIFLLTRHYYFVVTVYFFKFIKNIKMVTAINTFDTGHEDMIHDAELDYYGLRLATCSSDHSVKIYDVKNGAQTLLADLKGHYGPVWQISWAHPKFGNLLASCSYDRKVIIWKDMGEWKKLYEYPGHDSSVNSVQWAPYEFGLILACGSSDGSISILTGSGDGSTWDAKKITNAHTIGCNAVSWCPATVVNPVFDVNARAGPPVKRLVSGGCDNAVKIWKEDGDRLDFYS